jgi:hypothetical protein
MWFAMGLALLAGCGEANGVLLAAQARTAKSTPSLETCVLDWNKVPLGEGRYFAARDAVTGRAALMFAFQNGACGLAFPARTHNLFREKHGTFVTILGGDFSLRWSPLGRVANVEIANLRADASRYTNVMVQKKTGLVVSFHRQSGMLTVPASVFINPPGCKYAFVPGNPNYKKFRFISINVSCTQARTLLWGWATKITPEHPEATYITGWACVGTEKIRGVRPVAYGKITCTAGNNVVEAKNELREQH